MKNSKLSSKSELTIQSFTLLCFFLTVIICPPSMAQISLAFDRDKAPILYAANQLQKALAQKGLPAANFHHFDQTVELPDIYVITKGQIPKLLSPHLHLADFERIQPEGYEFRKINQDKTLLILSADEVGALYALLELAENIQIKEAYQIPASKKVNPTFEYRVVKFNLPWSSYRESEAMTLHTEVCRDLRFWESFLDMMAENRLNVLSLWNKHPFPYMIRAANFPKATPFDDQEMEEWQSFWKSLFRMAKQRGIQTFIVNWNIVVSPEFAEAYGAQEYNDLSEQVKCYTRESVTQLINEYEDLTGIGVTLADWMGTFDEKMTPLEREDWIETTFVTGMKAADRPVKFLHRSVLAGDPMAMRRLIDRADLPEPALVEIKFNWSHGHSTPKLAITHDYHSGELDDRFWTPMPENYKIQWMIRNEDFFILRWGQPDFIRKHIETNKQDYVNGYFIGSEGYIPAVDFSHQAIPTKTWQYAFEKQWLFYKVWGRLLYDHTTPDEVFVSAFEQRYGQEFGAPLLLAYKLASKMPLRLASFHRSTWDYTLYAEGFLSAERSSPTGTFDRSSPFISIEELIDHETLDPAMISISEYVDMLIEKKKIQADQISPIALADSSEQDSRKVLAIYHTLRPKTHPYVGALLSELSDVAAWAYLGLYFADKIRAGVALEYFRRTGLVTKKKEAIQLLEKCLQHWDGVIAHTQSYKAVPHVTTQRYGEEYQAFSWQLFRSEVVRDIEIAKGK